MAKNWAIVVGINQYEHLPPKAHLRCAVQDAEAVRLFLHQTAGFDAENILLCSDTSQPVGCLSTRPSRSNLRRLLKEEIQQAQGAEHLWLFFSGHGMVGKDRQAYLLPCDGYPNDLEETAISVAFVTDQLRHCQAKNVVMVLDMCRNEVPDDRKGAEITMSTQIEAISRQQGIITLFACSHNESSYEIREINQGAFTHVLLQGLKQHTILRQLEQYLLQEVPAINRKYGKPIQTPLVIPEPGWKYDLPLLPGCATEADVKVLLEGAKDAELEEKFEQAKSLWWQVIEASQSKAQIGEARKAIERINRKEKDLKQDPSSPSRQLDNPIHPFALPSPLPIQSVPPVPKNLPSSATPRPSPRALSNTQESNPIQVNPPPNPTLGKIVRSKSSSFMTRQQFLKWAGFGGGGLVAALIGNHLFQNSQTPFPYPSASSTTPTPLPVETVDFQTVFVNEQGQISQRSSRQAKLVKEDLGDGIFLDMVSVPRGEFLMGSAEKEPGSQSDEHPQRKVTVPAFCMSRYAVTQAQWKQVAAFPKVERDLDPDPAHFKGAKRPVERVSWEEAVEFCARLSRKLGKDYRLPSEAEWEYACRANTTTPFHFGATITPDLVNYDGNYPYGNAAKGKYREETTQVGSFPPNGFGLYDMHGNVWEWCADPWHENYQGAPTDGSAWGKDGDSNLRLLRGGSWHHYAVGCRSAFRDRWGRDDRDFNIGFRVVCPSPRTL